ncbi:MAG: cellulase family glycosylhydrolase [Bacteroidota bacterium]|nr:cellulase family glycosylhydrolase [Bacteroidota bacterium]
MKKKLFALLIIALLIITKSAFSQTVTTIHVSGRYILGPCNDTLILKGVNYAPYNWGWSPTQLRINQVALSGANCVRIPWYVTTPDGPTPQVTYNNLVNLDSALSKCVQNKMIPIVELHDLTCVNNATALVTLSNFFVQPAVKILINKYKHSIILNIANEALFVSWAGNPTAAQTTFSNTYSSIVNTIRSNSITVPIMIDGSECGTNLDLLANVGQVLQAADPQNNLIFSAHAYWYSFAGNDSAQALAKINNALTKNIPFVFGEVANLQDDVTLCQYTLNYKPWLKIITQKKLGWLAWSWDNDGCPARQITAAGSFTSLTAFGADIVNNPIYGLSVGTVKSKYLVLGSCGTSTVSTGLTQISRASPSRFVYPNPSSGTFEIATDLELGAVQAFDVLGKEINCIQLPNRKYDLPEAESGIYFIHALILGGKKEIFRFVINKRY